MRYFVATGEIRRLGPDARSGRRGAFAVLSDGTTHYELAGPESGPVFVFVPGLTIPLDFWDGVVGILHDRGFRTLTYSAYGRGFSDRLRGRYDRALFVRQLDDLVRHLQLNDVHVVASSMGALVALGHGRLPHAGVSTLTLSGPAGLSSSRNPVSLLPDQGPILPFLGKHLLRRNLLRHLAHNVQSADDADRLNRLVLEGFQYEGSMYALTSTLKHFPLADQDALFDAATALLPPMMLIWGANDQVTPSTGYDRAVALLKPARAEHLRDCGHMASFERPQQFADLLTSFVGELAHD
jgi:pimeloyl-ACP methyl ester carboxylesterase